MERLAFSGGQPARSTSDTRGLRSATPRGGALDSRLAREDRLAFNALLAFTIVLFIRPQDQLPFLEPLHLANLTGAFALIAVLAGRLTRGRSAIHVTPEVLAVCALAGIMLATAPFSVWPGGAVGVFTGVFSKVVIVFVLMVSTITTRQRLERFVTVVVLGTSYIAVRAVIDYGRGVNLVEDGRVTGAVGGLFGNPNDMALNMVAFLPLAVVVALGRGHVVLRGIALIGVPAMAAAIVFSKSRGGTVGLVAMLLVLLYQMCRVRPGVAALAVAAMLAAIPVLPASFTERMSSIATPELDPTGSREARKRLLRDGYQAFVDHPVFGLGAGQFQNYNPHNREETWRETHNAVLQVAAELGIAGLLAFIVVIVCGFAAVLRAGAALRRVRRGRRAREPGEPRSRREGFEFYAAALLASLTGWFVAAMFASVAYYWTLYLVLGLAVALREISLRELHGRIENRRRIYSAEAA